MVEELVKHAVSEAAKGMIDEALGETKKPETANQAFAMAARLASIKSITGEIHTALNDEMIKKAELLKRLSSENVEFGDFHGFLQFTVKCLESIMEKSTSMCIETIETGRKLK